MAAVIIKSDTMEGSSYQTNTQGNEATRAFVVQVTVVAANAVLAAALGAPGLPVMAALHPADSSICVTKITPRPLKGEDNQFIEVLVEYKPKTWENSVVSSVAGTWVVGSATVENKELFVDNTGKQLLVPWSGGPSQPNSVQVTACNAIVTFVRLESSVDMNKILTYVGSVNSDIFLGAAVRTCKMISIEPVQYGSFYKYTYKIQYNPSTWDVVLFYKDPQTRQVVSGALSEGNGYKTFRVYTEVAFGAIPLPGAG